MNFLSSLDNKDGMHLQMLLREKLQNIAEMRRKDYQRRNYVVGMKNFIHHQMNLINQLLPTNKFDVEANKEDKLMYEKYQALHQELPDYFFRAPNSAADCYEKIMDALDVLLEDKDLLASWELDLDFKIAKLEQTNT